MRDTASATEKVQQTCARSRTTVTRGFVSRWRLIRAEPVTLQLNHVTPVPPSFRRSHLDHVRPAHRMPGWLRQPASVLWVSAILERLDYSAPGSARLRDTVPRALSPLVRRRTRTSSRTKNCPSSPACACAKPWRVWVSSSAARVGRPPAAPLPLHRGRHVAQATEFHVCIKADPRTSPTNPGTKSLRCCFAQLARHLDKEQSLSSACSFASDCHREIVPARTCCIVAWPIPPAGAVLRASRPAAMHSQGVRVESAAQRTNVPQVPQESDTFRQSDVLVEARERAVQRRRDLHFFVQRSKSPTPTCQSLHAPEPDGAVAKTPRVELTVLWMYLPDDALVPDGLGNVLAVQGVRQHESCPENTCHSRQPHAVEPFVQFEVLAVGRI